MMLDVAAAQIDTGAWWVSLAVGLGVAVAVTTLLHLLLRTVSRVERNVIALWDTATNMAQNTATTWMLRETGQVLDDLEKELRRHGRLLGDRGAG